MKHIDVTVCYKCEHFLIGGHYDCQLRPLPYFSDSPSDDPLACFLVPCSVTWRTPDGLNIHCNSFKPFVKFTQLSLFDAL